MIQIADTLLRRVQLSLTYWGALMFAYVNAPISGNYTFLVNSDNGARLWVDSTLVVNATCRNVRTRPHLSPCNAYIYHCSRPPPFDKQPSAGNKVCVYAHLQNHVF